MAINLLGYVAPHSATALATGTPQSQTSTPRVVAQTQPNNSLRTLVGGKPIIQNQPMGVVAKSPYNYTQAPTTTLPKSQVAASVNTPPVSPPPNGAIGQANKSQPQTPANAFSLTPEQIANAKTPEQIAAQQAASGVAQSTTPNPASQAAAPIGTTNVAGANGIAYSPTNLPSQGGLLAQAANIASGPSADYLAEQRQANQYNQELQQSYGDEAQALANIGGAPHTLNFAQGAQNVIRNQALMQQQGLATAYQGAAGLLGAANTQQQNEAAGLTAAANSAAPIQVSPGNYLASPLTGVASSAAAGQAQGIQSATNWAIAQQNMAQGADYQGQSQSLSNAIQTMSPVGQKLSNFLSATGQNPATSPLVNQQISTINAQLYPQQVATLNAAVNDIRSYAIQILGSQSGANPTDVTSAVNSFDFTNFSAQDLANFLGDLNNLGNTRLSQLQSATNSSYGANAQVGTPAEGMIGTDQGALNTAGMVPSSDASNITKALLGSAADLLGGAANAIATNAGSAVGSAAGTGIAAKVLGLGAAAIP